MQMTPEGAGGWAEAWASRIDSEDRGFFGDLYRAPPGRRQVIFAVLAALELAAERDWELGRLGERLRLRKGTQLIAEHYGSDPSGYRNALAKLGPGAASPAFYARLHREFAAPADPRRLRLIRHLGLTGEKELDLLDRLDPVARLPNILHLVAQGRRDGVVRLNNLLIAIRTHCSRADDDALHRSLQRMTTYEQLSLWVERTLYQADRFPLPPWPGTEKLRPLTSAQAMSACAKEFRNCLRSRVLTVLDGDAYYYRWQAPGQVAVLTFGPAFPRVLGEVEVLGPRNEPVPAQTLAAIERELKPFGFSLRRSISNELLGLWERA